MVNFPLVIWIEKNGELDEMARKDGVLFFLSLLFGWQNIMSINEVLAVPAGAIPHEVEA